AVTAAKIRKQAVTSAKLAPKSVINGKLGPNSVGPGNIGNGAVTTAKLAAGSVIASTIKNGVITTNKLDNEAVTTPKLGKESVATAKLGNESVTSAKLGKGSVTAAKLSDEIGPLTGTLKSGQTLRGAFDVGATAQTANDEFAHAGVSYQFPLLNSPTATVLQPGETSANCSGLSGGVGQTPQAAAGNLCIYITEEANLDGAKLLAVQNNIRLGFGLVATSKEEGNFFALGQWAVTAP
ncbi:MAG TPA: hypothetical protein VIY71_05800, partial [Solirubrobacterales bacterium]